MAIDLQITRNTSPKSNYPWNHRVYAVKDVEIDRYCEWMWKKSFPGELYTPDAISIKYEAFPDVMQELFTTPHRTSKKMPKKRGRKRKLKKAVKKKKKKSETTPKDSSMYNSFNKYLLLIVSF